MVAFSDLNISPWLIKQLNNVGVHKPTPVQIGTIPHILAGHDCVACAKTGSGKTLAFLLPIIQKLSVDPYGIFALIIAPTRELVLQIGDQFKLLGRSQQLDVVICIGGRDMIEQSIALEKCPHVVIATPGRLVDHLTSCASFTLSRIQFLVLDEADRLIAGRFDDSLRTIFEHLPTQRQTLLFSATCNDTLQQLQSLSNNECVYYENMGDVATVSHLQQSYVMCAPKVKEATLIHVLNEFLRDSTGQVIVFSNTCRAGSVLSQTLGRLGVSSQVLHSQMKQSERVASLTKFKSCQLRVLFTTDVGSRGLDLPWVNLVINLDLPRIPKEYIHRVGRTARAGRKGRAISLLTPSDVTLFKEIEERTGQHMEEMSVNDEEIVKILTEVHVIKSSQTIKFSNNVVSARRRVNKIKDLILSGVDPDEAEEYVLSRSTRAGAKKRKKAETRNRQQSSHL